MYSDLIAPGVLPLLIQWRGYIYFGGGFVIGVYLRFFFDIFILGGCGLGLGDAEPFYLGGEFIAALL